jgi:hypothetical protein
MDGAGSQKRCSRCGELKDLREFSLKDRRKGILHGYCRACHAKWNRDHYQRNRGVYIKNANRNNARYWAENLARVAEYLRGHPCVDCGEDDLVVLEFDHRDRTMKRMPVSLMTRSYTWAEVEREIAKCDVRCANCHRRRTAQQFGWRKAVKDAASGQGRQELNPQPPDLESGALPIELRP